jgi:hypothetical protein
LDYSDVLAEDRKEIWIFDAAGGDNRLIFEPSSKELCILDCIAGSWKEGNILFISLYQSYTTGQSKFILEKLREQLGNNFPYTKFMKDDEINPIIEKILPGYSGWAAISGRKENKIDWYFATYYGPIVIVIQFTEICIDGCDVNYPMSQMNLSKMQIHKINKFIYT